MFSWNSHFFDDPQTLAIWSLVPLPFLKPAWNLEVHGPCTVEAWLTEFWALLCYRMRWVQMCSSLSILWHYLSLRLEWKLTFSSSVGTCDFSKSAGILSAALSQHHLSGFESTGIPSPPLALFIVTLPKAHLTSHSRMSGSRWMITPSWLSGSWRSFLYSFSVYSCHPFLLSAASYYLMLGPYNFCPLLCQCSLSISNFLEEIF